MLEQARTYLLQWLRIPAMPEAPWGAPETVRVFRAGRNYYKLRVLRWTFGQLLTLAGIIFWVIMLDRWERRVDSARESALAPAQLTIETQTALDNSSIPPEKSQRRRVRADDLVAQSPDWLFSTLQIFELLGLIGYLAQLPLTFALLRLDYELRWYIITDRSLRIRQGIWRVQESTMSFANLQQVAVTQGPVQRWLKLADVHVQSAGGGSGEASSRGHRENLHAGIFHGVDNASEIRDLILDRLRLFRATGLGDPDEARSATSILADPAAVPDSTRAAAEALLAEVQALRRTLSEPESNDRRPHG